MSDEERDANDEYNLPRVGDLLRWAEQTQRTIDFILRQQAESQSKSDADMQSLRDLQRRNEERWERTSGEIRALLAIAEIHERGITGLTESQARTDAQMAETDERLNALIDTVERMLGERRNGGGGRGEEKSG